MSDHIDPQAKYVWRLQYRIRNGTRLEYYEHTVSEIVRILTRTWREDDQFEVVRLYVLVPASDPPGEPLMIWRYVEVTPPAWKLVDALSKEVIAHHAD